MTETVENVTESDEASEASEALFDVDKIYTVEVSGLELAMILASLEGAAEDAIIDVLQGHADALPFVEPLMSLIDHLKATK